MSVEFMAGRMLSLAAMASILNHCQAREPLATHGLMRREVEGMASDHDDITVHGADASATSLLEKSDTGHRSLTLAGTCCGKASADAERLGYVPKNMTEFRRLWSGKMDLDRAEKTFQERAVRNDLKMVIGVMSFSKEDETRRIIRETWMNQPGVCIAAQGPKQDCSFYVVFVVGRKNYPDYKNPDVMHVDNDVPNIFKIKTFLHRVVTEFPWATHYGKMDTDTFPHVHKMLPRIPMPNSTCDVFFGATIPSHGCGLTVISDESKNAERKFACMHGSLYIFSRKLLEGMVQKKGVVDDWFSGKHQDIDSEDLNFGIALTQYVRQSKTCLNITEAHLPDDPGGLWDHCGVNCKGITGHGSFR